MGGVGGAALVIGLLWFFVFRGRHRRNLHELPDNSRQRRPDMREKRMATEIGGNDVNELHNDYVNELPGHAASHEGYAYEKSNEGTEHSRTTTPAELQG